MDARLGRVPEHVSARLPGYRLAFNTPMYDDPTHAYANIEPGEGHVLGVLYDCTAADLARLDVVEGVAAGHYARRCAPVEAEGRLVEAITYVGCRARLGTWLPTTDAYLATILEGARDHGFSKAEVARILAAAGRA